MGYRIPLFLVLAVSLTLGHTGRIFADDVKNTEGSEALNTETHQEVVAQFKQILERNKIVSQGPKPAIGELTPKPILNWDDIERGHYYGTLWVWGQQGRPMAIIEIFTVNLEKKVTGWPSNVVHSLSTDLVRPQGTSWDWAPEKPGLELKKLVGVPEPAATSTFRRIQMRTLAKRFTSDETYRGRHQLRLLSTAVHLYDSADDGILEGGIFAFVHGGTNPELMLILEAIEQNQEKHWQFGCARLTHGSVRVNFDEKEVWSVAPQGIWDPASAYYTLGGKRGIGPLPAPE
jgi:hypothetical protein